MSAVLWPTTWWQRHLGRPPAPAIGQVWRSAHSGRSVQVVGLSTTDCGGVFVDLASFPSDGPVNPLAMTYCASYGGWPRLLRQERRELVSA